MANIGTQQWGMAQPSLQKATDYYTQLLSGDPSKINQAIGPGVAQTNQYFNTARQNMVMGSQARGGGLTSGLAGLESQRASTLGGLAGNAVASAPQALAALGGGQSMQALQALGGAQQAGVQNTVLQNQAMGGIGSFLTRLLSGMNFGGGGPSGAKSSFFGTPSALVGNNPGSFPGQDMNYYPPSGQGNSFYGQ